MNETLIKIINQQRHVISVEWISHSDLETLDKKVAKEWYSKVKHNMDSFYGRLRPRICLACGNNFASFDTHHAICSRRDVQGCTWGRGTPYSNQLARLILIPNIMNCLPLCHTCNTDHPPSREAAWEYQMEFYGRDLLEQWYFSLPFRIGPPRLF